MIVKTNWACIKIKFQVVIHLRLFTGIETSCICSRPWMYEEELFIEEENKKKTEDL